jgi:arylformamidase
MLTLDLHCGTHVDAPAHFLAGAAPMGAFDPATLCGRAVVVDGTGLHPLPASLARHVPAGVDGVLFRTDNSVRGLMRAEEFEPGFAALSRELAEELASRPEIRFVGNDYLSIQPYRGDRTIHTVLMDRGIAIIEGVDLTDVVPGQYEMLGLTLSLPTAEAAPARILLRPV